MSGNSPSLLGLPYEIRESIYLCLSDIEATDAEYSDFNCLNLNPPLHSLLRTCSQLRHEFFSIFYGSHIFHLRMISAPFRPSTKGPFYYYNCPMARQQQRGNLLKWASLPPPMLSAFREVMLHVSPEILKSQNFVPTSRSYFSSILCLAPNIEVLHVTTCISVIEVNSLAHFVADAIRTDILPRLMRVVLHVNFNQHVASKVLYSDLHKLAPLEWCKSESKSFAIGICGGLHLRESHFRVTDRRRLPPKISKKIIVEELVCTKTEKNAEGKRRKDRFSVEAGGGAHLVRSVIQPHTITDAFIMQESGVGNSDENTVVHPEENESNSTPSSNGNLDGAEVTGQETQNASPSASSGGIKQSCWSGKITVTQLRHEIDRINRLLLAGENTQQAG